MALKYWTTAVLNAAVVERLSIFMRPTKAVASKNTDPPSQKCPVAADDNEASLTLSNVKATLRRGTISVEQLHLKVRSLISKAAPGPWTALTEVYARDAFMAALDDEELQRRILLTCPPPETLTSAYGLALRSMAVDAAVGRTRDRSSAAGETRHARTLADASAPPIEPKQPSPLEVHRLAEENRRLQQQIAELCAAIRSPPT